MAALVKLMAEAAVATCPSCDLSPGCRRGFMRGLLHLQGSPMPS